MPPALPLFFEEKAMEETRLELPHAEEPGCPDEDGVLEGKKRERFIGTLRAVYVLGEGTYKVVPTSPTFGSLDDWDRWVVANHIPGVLYGWIREGRTIVIEQKRVARYGGAA